MLQKQNPWEFIRLSDVENYMENESGQQKQVLNRIVREQIESTIGTSCKRPVIAMMGITSGNGLEHVEMYNVRKIIGTDINMEYIGECKKRYQQLGERLELHCVDMMQEIEKTAKLMERADLITANLFIEHIHLDNFIGIMKHMRKRRRRISCVIQYNPKGNVVSASGYEQCFDGIYNLVEEEDRDELYYVLSGIGYRLDLEKTYPLANGTSLIRMDFVMTR